jgi:hypothetical protein
MDTLAEHLLHPEVSMEEHLRRSVITLGRSLGPRRAIYLDTKFWILLRDAERFPDQAEGADLLDLLRRGVANGTLFCPISESVFVELMKQSDHASRLATASLIDDLSLGVTLIEQEMRLAAEIAHVMYAKSGRNNLHPLEHLVWCKLSFVLGFLYPTRTGFDPATELAVQKAFFDHMWAIPLRQMITMIGDADMPGKDLSDIALMLNDGIAAHADELRSFEQTYAAEVRGMVDLVGGKAVDIMLSMAREDGVVVAPPTPRNGAYRRTSLRTCLLSRWSATEPAMRFGPCTSWPLYTHWYVGTKGRSLRVTTYSISIMLRRHWPIAMRFSLNGHCAPGSPRSRSRSTAYTIAM